MAKVTMPQLGESAAEGTIGKWLKQLGDTVAKDEPLLEVITDKGPKQKDFLNLLGLLHALMREMRSKSRG